VMDWIEERQQLTDRLKQLNNFALQAANDKNWPQAISQIQEAIFASGAPNSVFFTRT